MEAVEDSSQNVSDNVVKKLQAAIGAENVKTSKFERLLYSHDLAPLPKEAQIAFKNIPDIVVRPRSTEDVAKVVKIANEEGVPITPRGASTWGLGGSMPAYGGILFDMIALMNKVVEIDTVNMTVTAQAGASWKIVYDACMEKGFLLGSYPSSFPSASIAGWTSTGGIGIGNYKYGSAADNIRSMVVVMPDGSIVHTGFESISDNMSGYNLTRLIAGAEGTLGVITEITFKLTPAPEVLRPLAYSFAKLEDMGAPLADITHSRVMPLHIAWSDAKHFEMLRKMGRHAPNEGNLLLITLEGDKVVVDHEEQIIDAIVQKHGGRKVSEEVAKHEWDERSYEFRCREIGLGAIPGEVVVPVSAFSDMAKGVYGLMNSMKMEVAIIGILADRNTAMFMPYYLFDPESLTKTMTSLSFNAKTSDIAYKFGGRPTGFGIFFSPNLKKIRGDSYEHLKTIKKALDPNDIMNPGKMLGMKTRFGLPVGSGVFDFGMTAMATVKKVMPRDKIVDKKAQEYVLEKAEKEKESGHKEE